MRLRRAASTAPSACPRRQPCSPWRASPRMSPTGTPTRSSVPTARAGSPPGWSRSGTDGLVYASSMVVLYAARHRVPVPWLARWLLGLGIAATFTANMAQGWSHGPVGAVVAAWPAACNFNVGRHFASLPNASSVQRSSVLSCSGLGHLKWCLTPVPPIPGGRRGVTQGAWHHSIRHGELLPTRSRERAALIQPGRSRCPYPFFAAGRDVRLPAGAARRRPEGRGRRASG